MPSPEQEIAASLYSRYKQAEAQMEMPEELLSREYKIFAGKKTGYKMLYEQLAQMSGRIFKYPVDKETKQEVDSIFQSFDLNIEAEDAYSFSVMATVATLIFGLILLPFSRVFGGMVVILSFIVFFYYRSYPKQLVTVRRSRAATEIILSILYIVIYMKNISNLEAAIKFAAENLEGPLGTDYKKMLWDVTTKKYADISEALDNYVAGWKKYNEAFSDSIYLIETSLVQRSDERRLNMLDQALKRIMDGTYETMVHYVNDLRTPVSAVFMMGITLPIMGLVMLPLIGAFMADLLSPTTLFVFYDIVLPLAVIAMIRQVLSTRPAAFPQINLAGHPLVPPKDCFYFMGRTVHAAVPAIIVGIILCMPYVWYSVTIQDFLNPSEFDVLFSLFPILAGGLGIATYCHFASGIRVKLRKEIKAVENDFGYAVMQIANRIAEGVPAEIAMLKTAGIMKESKVRWFIKRIADNMSKLGMDLKRAIFDKKYGAIIMYPSTLIRSVMKIFIESVKESEEVAAASLEHIAHYLQSVHNIEEKIQDVLSETLSTVKFQATFIGPLIAGIIVGLTSMIMIILAVLGEKIGAATSAASVPGAIGGGGMGDSMAFGFFQMSSTIPLPLFQLVVGIYLIQINIISTILASKIEYGDDYIQQLDSIKKSLAIATIIYFVVALGVTIAFAGMAKIAVAVGEFA